MGDFGCLLCDSVRVQLLPLRSVEVLREGKDRAQAEEQLIRIPFVFESICGVLLHLRFDFVGDQLLDGGLQRRLAQKTPPLHVDRLALLVDDFVIFEHVLAYVEVVALDAGLRVLDRLADHIVFDRLIVLQAEPVHYAGHAVAAKTAHKVVLQAEEEAARARVTQATGTAAQLVVDAPRFVAFGANHIETASGLHLFLVLLRLVPPLFQHRGPTACYSSPSGPGHS